MVVEVDIILVYIIYEKKSPFYIGVHYVRIISGDDDSFFVYFQR